MGCTSSSIPDESEQTSRKLDRKLREEQRRAVAVMKLLLLGAGESGKSTIFKQMKILHGAGFSGEEKVRYRAQIHVNVVKFMKHLCEAVESLGLEGLTSGEGLAAIQSVRFMDDDANLSEGAGAGAMRALWDEDPAIQEAWRRRSEFFLIETHSYFFEPGKLEAVCAVGYDPSEADILRVRARTSGIIEKRFKIQGKEFSIIDVGGQKSERRKWMSCFSGVHGVIFVAALSEYDQALFEDENLNRMVDSIKLFKSIISDSAFENTAMILFLNKKDLFERKVGDPAKHIARVPAFKDFPGPPSDYAAGVKYFRGKFEATNKTGKDIYVHETCATDTTLIRKVIDDCQAIVLKAALQDSGFMA